MSAIIIAFYDLCSIRNINEGGHVRRAGHRTD